MDTLERHDIERAQALFNELIADCWIYDNRGGEIPELHLSELPLPIEGEYPAISWTEAQQRARTLLRGLPSTPNITPLSVSLSAAAALKRSEDLLRQNDAVATIAPVSETDPAELEIATARNGIEMFILCDQPDVETGIWLYAADWVLFAFEEWGVGQGLKHPIAPLLRAWLDRPTAIAPSTNRRGIIPNQMQGARALGYLPGFPPDDEPQLGLQEMAMLPEFEVPDSFIVPTAMVFTYRAGGGQAQTRGRGAPLSKRIFYDVLTALPQDSRRGQGKWRLEFTLRDLRDWLYPSVEGRPTSFKMGRHLERIRAALWEVGNMRIERTLHGNTVPSLWLPIAVRAMPVSDLDSPVVFDIELPPGSSGGALIDRQSMRRYGLVSAPQHSASLGLAYFWDRYGTFNGRRILATRPRIARNQNGLAVDKEGNAILDRRNGQPISGYTDRRLVFLDDNGNTVHGRTPSERIARAARERNHPAIERYPILTDTDLLLLCYPEDGATLTNGLRRERLFRAKRALEEMAGDNYCVIEEGTDKFGRKGWRILPVHPIGADGILA